MMVMLTMIQVAGVTLPGWIGLRTSPGFGPVNLASGEIALAVLIIVMLWGGKFRRGFILAGLAAGTLFFAFFRPIPFSAVIKAPWLVAPIWLPFGFGVRLDFVVVFLLTLIPAIFSAIALYQMVADWGGERMTPGRTTEGLFAMSVGAAQAGVTGGFSTMVYPDNIGILRSTRVSRYATLAAGVILVVLGSVIKFDMLLVIVPLPILATSATLLFGIVFMHGVQTLNMVKWNDRSRIAEGLALFVGLGGLFVSPETLHAMPIFARLLPAQPISGGVTLAVLSALLGLLKTDEQIASEGAEPRPAGAV